LAVRFVVDFHPLTNVKQAVLWLSLFFPTSERSSRRRFTWWRNSSPTPSNRHLFSLPQYNTDTALLSAGLLGSKLKQMSP